LEQSHTPDKWIQKEEMDMSIIQMEQNESWDETDNQPRNNDKIKNPEDIDSFLKTEYCFQNGNSIIQGTVGPVNGTI
jgi:hypothetical protein